MDEYWDEDELEAEDWADEEGYDDTDARLSAVEHALAGKQEMVSVPAEFAEAWLASEEEAAEEADIEEALGTELAEIETMIGRELTSQEAHQILDAALEWDALPTEVFDANPQLVLDDLGSDDDRAQLFAQTIEDVAEEQEAGFDTMGEVVPDE
jgi:hypothetical protein